MAGVGRFSLLAVLVYVADEYPAAYAGAGAQALEASVVSLYSIVVIVSGWVRVGCARLCGVHRGSSLWAGLRGASPPAGPFPYPTSIIVHYRLAFVYISYKIIYKLAYNDWRRRMLTVVKIDGDKVRVAREQRFLSQRELAGKAGINHNTVWRIETSGPTDVHPRTIRKIAEALSVDPTSLTPQE
jgi:DNA-binding XRE family transcriptional regulator